MQSSIMHLGLDLNASRVRAVQGPAGDYALPLPLDPPAVDLPMAISLERSTPQVGLAGVRLLRHLPHLAAHSFLPVVGTPSAASHHWKSGRRHLDANGAMELVWQRLQSVARKSSGVVLTVPAYFQKQQLDWLRSLAERSKVAVLGSLPAPLAAALAGFAEQTWIGSVLVLDIDEHALSLAHVRAMEGQAHLLEMRSFPHLGLRFWKDRLINALADCCVLQSRRDPRDAPMAEQGLYEQLDGLLNAVLYGRVVQIGIQGAQWYQNLLVTPEQAQAFCSNLVQQTVREIEDFCSGLPEQELPGSILVTGAVGQLPGLATILRTFVEECLHQPTLGPVRPQPADEDFGVGLLEGSPGEMASVVLLAADSPARAAHSLAASFNRGELPRGHLELSAPLPLPLPLDAGPPRLHYRGQDFFLDGPSFFLGAQGGCHMVIDPRHHPGVALRHCEILFDHRTFLLFNRCREGTLVNDSPVAGSAPLHAGDWIRLGPDGPLIRFMGHGGAHSMTTTA
ncbi:MAG: FHA domain-containing protein [Planctomycetes bacterium]|nr:FHA domain-containing protein [Planctomycetota bacterium]